MSDWWYVIAIVALAAAGGLYLLYRRSSNSGSRDGRQDSAPTRRDYATEREDVRLAHMSEEDRTWQAASLQRDRDKRERDDDRAEQHRPSS